ncbi:Ras-related protein Rab-11A isoform 1 [Aphelenchoides fujianensis]|nr:Ras-related protein Rab-11A isoform 1 [Aphelenchoides fujianensis]
MFDGRSRETIGVEIGTRRLSVDGKTTEAQIWDTAGQERYRTVVPVYCRCAVGALLVFERVGRWLHVLERYAELRLVVLLVGNRSDLRPHAVSNGEAAEGAKRNDLLFVESSALDCSNVDLAFTTLVTEICRSGERERNASDRKGVVSLHAVEKGRQRACCF